MKYKASWDNLTKIITVGVTVLFLGIFGSLFVTDGKPDAGSSVVIAVILFVTYFVSYIFRPVGYAVSDGKLIIQRPFNEVVIEKSKIRSVEILDDEKLKWTFRTFGVGGLFGYYGKFYNSKIGHMTWYATRRNKAVLVKTVNNKNIILTPDEAADFVRQFDTPRT
ncbi:PH domain-containing protein [Dyadobacter sp. CY323]|uniref:PH domain-containing protein n=1 Tax=Dyadobacter sp. CY323 TaxID=2907302 RepID=UPI001F1C7C8A|nr:PH domain-containing protein [Dyadobacter sp. CY323]MCE6991859.1 PH domain-containing protein [Dyadobacter sp. CY323]